MTSINLAMVSNATDEELIKICDISKPESEFEPVDYLVVELVKRLEATKEHATGYDKLYEDLIKLKEDVDNLFKTLTEQHEINF